MKRLFEIVVLLLLAGCQTPMPMPPPAPHPTPAAPVCPEPPAPPVDQLGAVTAYVEDLRKALTLSQGRGSADLAQAAAQIEVLAGATDAPTEPLRAMAALISARLAEQRRLQDNVDKLTLQLRDSQRRNEQLNEKLEALKAIEQTLPAKR
ncbi:MULTISPECIES: hypothetical protein [unclassified Roseateles]|uniref:hypothetical protein n=1 Tax=unclassified Roseateles TaxID=2626991 RepID=UPI0006F9CDE0|nr:MULTISPECIES: hypothetical protein [unclassified Roseateles]KQW42379.1 hypothetical protein ASC81_21215 [Pelomonas sp. Root405]KRA68253.1 hypothetical protein ASD88_22800 [Pelomonas sp. Root662]